MSLKITLTAIICYQCTRKDKMLYSRFKSPDMNNSVSSRQDECHVNHSRLPQAIYLYSSTLLALSNDFSKSFTQQRSSHFTIHIKGVKKNDYLNKRYFCWADKEVKQPKIAPSLSSLNPLSAVTEWLWCAQHASRGKKHRNVPDAQQLA